MSAERKSPICSFAARIESIEDDCENGGPESSTRLDGSQRNTCSFRFVALTDDNFYPVSLEDLAHAERREDPSRLQERRRTETSAVV